MSQCVSLIAPPTTASDMGTWALVAEMMNVIHTASIENGCIIGGQFKGDEICIDGDCPLVAGAVLHECTGSENDLIQRISAPFTMEYRVNELGQFCFTPCFQWENLEACPQIEEPDYVAYLCEQELDPCKRWARLVYERDELILGMQLQSGSMDGSSKAFNVNFQHQCEKLDREIAQAKTRCLACNPCGYKGIKPRKRRLMSSIPATAYKRGRYRRGGGCCD